MPLTLLQYSVKGTGSIEVCKCSAEEAASPGALRAA